MTFNFDGIVAQALGAVANGFAVAIIPLLRNSLYDCCIVCRNNGSIGYGVQSSIGESDLGLALGEQNGGISALG
jgi:hypothetical protein